MLFMSHNLLVALTLCSFAVIQAFPMEGFAPIKCRCIQTSPNFVHPRLFKRLEILPAGAHCRYTEIIITKKDNSTVCVAPDEKWINRLVAKLQQKQKRAASQTGNN
ncbi:hypothetical protein DPEC_G00118900 [Dallia pectoralis]|uniref:Uncharacterized protein n=1 Tax=Dallia pectoralis TaxID=75939 RepID=A0ACC2GPE3_DALPE|nr:hypothetical protein DPEC_G00118900 [Dallia pectoralis]